MAWRRGILAAALSVVVLAACGDDSGDSVGDEDLSNFQILGDWNGELHQKGLPRFRVFAHIGDLDDPAANTVHYTGIDCGGNWTYLGRDRPQRGDYRFREVIDRGAGGSCKGTGIVTLIPEAESIMSYVFRGGGIESVGTLTFGKTPPRKGPPEGE